MGFSEIFCIIGWLAIAFSEFNVFIGCLVARCRKTVVGIWDGSSFLCGAYICS
uniref:Uncharacterized protein n=1 Tax=Rhizophora mucronata TaxID=61149 RepID=A0A2P2J2Q7_RHIMU